MKKIIAIFGCGSSEHDVSVITAIEALNACPYGEYKVYPVYVKGGEWYSSDSMLGAWNRKRERKKGGGVA